MTFDMGNNTNKLILLVVAAVALLLALNIYQKQLGKNVAIVLAVVTIVVVVGVGVSLMTQNGSANNNALINNALANNNAPINNVVEGFYGDGDTEYISSGLAEGNEIHVGDVPSVASMLPNSDAVIEGENKGGGGVVNRLARDGKHVPVIVEEEEDALKACLKKAGGNKNAQAKCKDGFTGSRENFQNNTAAEEAVVTASGNTNPVDGVMKCDDLLPGDTNSTWAQVSPAGLGSLCDKNLLNAGHHVGVNTTGTSLRNANRGIRSEPPCPQVNVSPWLQTTIAPDLLRRPLE
jgi:hypothetical protein